MDLHISTLYFILPLAKRSSKPGNDRGSAARKHSTGNRLTSRDIVYASIKARLASSQTHDVCLYCVVGCVTILHGGIEFPSFFFLLRNSSASLKKVHQLLSLRTIFANLLRGVISLERRNKTFFWLNEIKLIFSTESMMKNCYIDGSISQNTPISCSSRIGPPLSGILYPGKSSSSFPSFQHKLSMSYYCAIRVQRVFLQHLLLL